MVTLFMRKRRNMLLIKCVACILAIIFVMPYPVTAATQETIQPYASDFLISYTSYICHMGSGELQIWFRVTGVDDWADIGVLEIVLFESVNQTNWTWVETFQHMEYPEMLDHDSGHHMDYVTYQGKLGRYYKAYVAIWAGSETDGDIRYIWTPV